MIDNQEISVTLKIISIDHSPPMNSFDGFVLPGG
jgi:hypothetical protein